MVAAAEVIQKRALPGGGGGNGGGGGGMDRPMRELAGAGQRAMLLRYLRYLNAKVGSTEGTGRLDAAKQGTEAVGQEQACPQSGLPPAALRSQEQQRDAGSSTPLQNCVNFADREREARIAARIAKLKAALSVGLPGGSVTPQLVNREQIPTCTQAVQMAVSAFSSSREVIGAASRKTGLKVSEKQYGLAFNDAMIDVVSKGWPLVRHYSRDRYQAAATGTRGPSSVGADNEVRLQKALGNPAIVHLIGVNENLHGQHGVGLYASSAFGPVYESLVMQHPGVNAKLDNTSKKPKLKKATLCHANKNDLIYLTGMSKSLVESSSPVNLLKTIIISNVGLKRFNSNQSAWIKRVAVDEPLLLQLLTNPRAAVNFVYPPDVGLPELIATLSLHSPGELLMTTYTPDCTPVGLQILHLVGMALVAIVLLMWLPNMAIVALTAAAAAAASVVKATTRRRSSTTTVPVEAVLVHEFVDTEPAVTESPVRCAVSRAGVSSPARVRRALVAVAPAAASAAPTSVGRRLASPKRCSVAGCGVHQRTRLCDGAYLCFEHRFGDDDSGDG